MSANLASNQVKSWLSELEATLAAGDVNATLKLFSDDCYWRDLLSFSWSVITCEGRDEIAAMLESCLSRTSPATFALQEVIPLEEAGAADAIFTFETATAACRGYLRLRGGRCWTLFTCVDSLKGHEERLGARRERGGETRITRDQIAWGDKRRQTAATLGYAEQPFCLIVGGGQGGITLAARLKVLGVPALVVDKQERPGDAWRNRYKSLCLHDPVWEIHLPYIPFPDHWPIFTPKDKMGDWVEAYASMMELDYWSSSEATKASYDEERGEWAVEVMRAGKPVTLKPKHLVITTGLAGKPSTPEFRGADVFAGEQLHSSSYRSGAGYAGKRAIVVGSNNSAHDICGDLWQNGADVTMIQRSSATVVRIETLIKFFSDKEFAEHAAEPANIEAIERDDFMSASRPIAVRQKAHKGIYDELRKYDAAFYAKLEAAGFKLDFGEDETGLSMKFLRRGAGYYIDVGASELLSDGRIKLRSGVQIDHLKADGVVLSDGSFLSTDVIIHATGFEPMESWIENLISAEVRKKVGHIWGVGSGTRDDPGPWLGELRNMWRPTAQESLWIHGGNLQLARFFSKILALQLKARFEGIPVSVYDPKGLPQPA